MPTEYVPKGWRRQNFPDINWSYCAVSTRGWPPDPSKTSHGKKLLHCILNINVLALAAAFLFYKQVSLLVGWSNVLRRANKAIIGECTGRNGYIRRLFACPRFSKSELTDWVWYHASLLSAWIISKTHFFILQYIHSKSNKHIYTGPMHIRWPVASNTVDGPMLVFIKGPVPIISHWPLSVPCSPHSTWSNQSNRCWVYTTKHRLWP